MEIKTNVKAGETTTGTTNPPTGGSTNPIYQEPPTKGNNPFNSN